MGKTEQWFIVNNSIIIKILLALVSVHANAHASQELPDVPVRMFMERCSGVVVTNAVTNTFAYGVCLGYVRGIVDGHQLTVGTMKRNLHGGGTTVAQLWCMPPKTTNDVLMGVIFSWVHAHPEDVHYLLSRQPSTTGATSIITSAIRSKFAC